jgi:hypothetical protein
MIRAWVMVEVNRDFYMFSTQKKRSWLVGMQPYLVTAGLGRDKSGVDMGSPGVNRTSVRRAEWHCAVYWGVFNVTSKRHHQLSVTTQYHTRDKQKTEAELEKRQTIRRKLRIAPISPLRYNLLRLLHTVPRQKSKYSFSHLLRTCVPRLLTWYCMDCSTCLPLERLMDFSNPNLVLGLYIANPVPGVRQKMILRQRGGGKLKFDLICCSVTLQ